MSDRSSLLTDPFGPHLGTQPFEAGTLPTAGARPNSLLSDPFGAGDRLADAAKRATTTTPDQAARIFALQKKTGFPAEVIQRNLDTIEQQTSAADFDLEHYRATSPLLASWLAADPNHLALAQVDLGPLSAMEKTLAVGRHAIGALASGVAGFSAGAWGAIQSFAELPIAGPTAPFIEGMPAPPIDLPTFDRSGPDWTRVDGSQKGDGFLGLLKRPDGGVMSEFSIADSEQLKDAQGHYRDYPSLVPTLTKDEITSLLTLKPGDAVPQGIKDKAEAFALEREKAGLPLFAGAGEQRLDLFPEIARGGTPADIRLSPGVAAAARITAAIAKSYQDRWFGTHPGAGMIESGVYSGLQSVGQMAPTLALGLIAGPEAALAATGITTGGQTYSQGREEGLSAAHSLLYGGIQGAVEVATEFIPVHRLLKDVTEHSGFILTLAHQMIPEVAGEEIATAFQDLNDWANLPSSKDKTFHDYLAARPDAAVQTLVATVLATGVTVGGSAGIARLAGGPMATKVVTDLGTAATSTTLAKVSPDKFGEAVAHAAAGGLTTLYAPVSAIDTYAQSQGVAPERIAEQLTGDPDALAHARETNTDLPIPIGAYASQIAGTPANAFFAQELRLDPDWRNGREDATATAADVSEAVHGAQAAPPSSSAVSPADAKAVHEELVTRLVEGGQMGRSTADTTATILTRLIPNVADRSGLDLQQLVRDWLPTIQSVAAGDTAVVGAEPALAARFLGYQHTGIAGEPPIALYNVGGDTWDAQTLIDKGIPVPETPPVPETFEQRLRPRPIGPRNARGEAAYFMGWEPGVNGAPAQPLYTIEGGPRHGTSVTGEELTQLGIDAPPTPVTLHHADHRAEEWKLSEPPRRLASTFEEARAAVAEFQGKRLTNNRTPTDVAIVGRDALDKMLHRKAVAQSTSPAEHALAVANLDQLFERAVLGESHPDKNRNPNIKQIHRWYAPLQVSDGVVRLVKLTVKELTAGNEIPRIYTVEAITVEGNDPAVNMGSAASPAGKGEGPDTTRPAGSFTSLVDAIRAYNSGEKLFAGDPTDPLASITFQAGAAPAIHLFASRNLTSVLHEFGHLALTMLDSVTTQLAAIDPAARTATQQQLIGDMAALRTWLADEEHTGPGFSVKQQEQMARGLEAYLLEGQAPSSDLRRVFRRIKSWMVQAYTNLAGLSDAAGFDVQINDDVRAVFDRLLASDDAIAAAEAEGATRPMFLTQPEGMSDAEWAAYRTTVQDAHAQAVEGLEQRLMREQQREQRDAWKAEQARLRAEIAPAVADRPVYRAAAAIRDGLRPDGSALPDGAIKLSREAIEGTPNQAPTHPVALEPGKAAAFLRAYTAPGGLHPDVAAEQLGFPSGAALVDALASAPPMARVIATEVAAQMTVAHPSTLTDGTLRARARQAVGEHQATVVRAELAALAKMRRTAAPLVHAARVAGADALAAQQETIDALTGDVRDLKARTRSGAATIRGALPSAAAVAAHALERVAGMKLTELRPTLFLAAARRASLAATEHAARQDFDRAIAAKQQELVNLAIYKEVIHALDEVQAFRDTATAFYRPDATLAKTRAMELVSAARLVADTFLHPERRSQALDALDLVKKYDPDLSDALDAQIRIAMAGGTTPQDLTVDGFLSMRDTTMALWTQSLRSQQIVINGRKEDRARVMAALRTRLGELGTQAATPGYTRAMTTWEKTKFNVMGMVAGLKRVEHWVHAMDGSTETGAAVEGVFRRSLFTPVSEAADRYRTAIPPQLTAYRDLLAPIEATLTRTQIAAPELVGPEGAYTFSGLAEVLGALQHAGNQSNLEKLLLGRGWGSIAANGSLDASRFDAFRARLEREGILTRAHYEALQGIWDLFEGLKPAAQQAHRELYGFYFSEITATPLATSFGTFRGGYVPALADPFLVPDANIKAEERAVLEGGNSFLFPATRPGFTKARVTYNKPLIMDLGLVPMQIDKVLKLIHLYPAVKDVSRIVFDRGFRTSLDAFDNAAAGELLVPWLQRASSQQVSSDGSNRAVRGLNALARKMRTSAGLNIMTGSFVNAAQQITGLPQVATQVPWSNIRSALYRYLRNPRALAEANIAASEFMAHVSNGQGLEMQRQIQDILLNPSVYKRAKSFADAHGYFLSGATQNMVNHVGFAAAYDHASETMGHDDAVRHANSVIRETQGSFAPEDVSRFETGWPIWRLFNQFQSYFNNLANLHGVSGYPVIIRDMGLRKGAGRALYLFTWGFMTSAVLADVVRQAMSGADSPDDDPDWWLHEFLSTFFGSQFRQATSMLPGVGPAINRLVTGFEGGAQYNDSIAASPAISMIEKVAAAPGEIYQSIMKGELAKGTVRDALTMLGFATGLPIAPLGKPLGYLTDVANEKEPPPKDALAMTRGLVTGRSQK
jgi:hypothetical protein